jgi:anti-sigma regulatory factor (Ser/Thr protein kinase)
MGKWSADAVMENLDAAVEFAAAEGERIGFAPAGLNRIRLAVEELVVNIIHYAYLGKTGKVEMECSENKKPKGLKIVIRDGGVPFDPLSCAPEAATRLPVEDRNIGGLGIHMVRTVMNEMAYSRESGSNILTMVKYLD